MNHYTLLLLLGSVYSCFCMENPLTQVLVIDPLSIATMGPKMPDDIALSVEIWKEKNKELLYTLIHDTNELPLTPESLIQHKNRVCCYTQREIKQS